MVRCRAFKEHKTNAKHFVRMFPWGGREEVWRFRDEGEAMKAVEEVEC